MMRGLAKLIGTELKSWAGNMQVDTPVATEKVTAANSASAAIEDEESIENIGQMIQDLAHTDNAEVSDTLDALKLDLKEGKKKCDKIYAAGGCLALIRLDKAIDIIPACNQVIDLKEFAELTTLHKTLHIMISLTQNLDESKVGMAVIGDVEAVVEVMKTLPSAKSCRSLQVFSYSTWQLALLARRESLKGVE